MSYKKEVSNNQHDSKFKEIGWGHRHQQCIILFCILTIAYSMRSCMGVSLVAMTDFTNDHNFIEDQEIKASEDFRPKGILNSLMLVPPYPKFNWSKKVQDTVIASFFWGYMLLQVPAGQLAHRFGAKYMLTGAMTINFVVSILFPVVSYYGGWYCAVICRLTQGLSQACIVPGLHTTLGKWAPLRERGRLASIVYGGQALGTVFGLPLTGFISSSFLGWPGIFRFYGVLSGLASLVVWFLVYDTPHQHKKISDVEKEYIESELGGSDGKKKMPVPWLKILSYKGVYAIIIAHIGQTWGQVFLYSEVPAYLDKIMGVNIKSNGLLSALPFLIMWLSNFFFSWLTDWLIIKNIASVTNTRKIANSVGMIPAGIGLIALAYAPHNIYVVETILVLICSFKIAAQSGFQVNHIDISPNFAGTMMSVSSFAANIIGSFAPIATGFILTDIEDQHLWRLVFFMAAGFYFFANVVYVILGTAEKADWNEPQKCENVEESLPMMIKSHQ